MYRQQGDEIRTIPRLRFLTQNIDLHHQSFPVLIHRLWVFDLCFLIFWYLGFRSWTSVCNDLEA